MFSSSVQPGIVSLFSSTSSDPLALFSTHIDAQLPSDSFIHLLNDSKNEPAPAPPASLIEAAPTSGEGEGKGYELCQKVLHLQSPTIRKTYIRCPRDKRRGSLRLKHPWMHIQVRDMGREWSFEVGVVDRGGREGIIRCSTFQKSPRLTLSSPPLLHLPLSFPPPSPSKLTTWSTVALNLPSLLSHFTSTTLLQAAHRKSDEQGSGGTLPSGSYSHVSYVKVYATCRLRRIWFSETMTGSGQSAPWEFQLYAAE
ncbi:hypothetical protein GLOTRDRAFT_117588 [Gloeophyllum trabeum ATCC 11539]|uniref:CFA20 domain-containing protein n=1 Tax=Gloeophyllum trabeum (strain ATCC 11539 / FP-39264 / Madison 617) TaxID=670483 RepID=S7PX70_GLOTA|nr:uncharacterized protein GLOTRDRAFT_117588 [Gloeophyllum trabeum ATCC 11539]EPQ52093.1 hypothetical protein GLOTRDRAFT_117588 [Gloeophyllum trabeum ATCC 11539]